MIAAGAWSPPIASRAMRQLVVIRLRSPVTGHRSPQLQHVFDGDDFAALVVPALRADAMGHLRFVALRTCRERLRFEEVVGTTRARPGLRVSSFWIRHDSS